jgi:hypothetical protein
VNARAILFLATSILALRTMRIVRETSHRKRKGNPMKQKTPPPTLKDIVDSIAAARGVTLYR